MSIDNNSEEQICFDLVDEDNKTKQRYLVPSNENVRVLFLNFPSTYLYSAECVAEFIELEQRSKFFFLSEIKFEIDENGELQ